MGAYKHTPTVVLEREAEVLSLKLYIRIIELRRAEKIIIHLMKDKIAEALNRL